MCGDTCTMVHVLEWSLLGRLSLHHASQLRTWKVHATIQSSVATPGGEGRSVSGGTRELRGVGVFGMGSGFRFGVWGLGSVVWS